MNQTQWKGTFLGAGLLLCLGCGGGADRLDLVPVEGTVYLDDAAHGPASLSLYPVSEEGTRGPQVSASVGADGKFTLTTYEEGDGAPPGEYQAGLRSAPAGGGAGGGDPSVDPAAMMAAAAGEVATEELKVTIPEDGTESLELKFKSTRKSGGGGGTLLGN